MLEIGGVGDQYMPKVSSPKTNIPSTCLKFVTKTKTKACEPRAYHIYSISLLTIVIGDYMSCIILLLWSLTTQQKWLLYNMQSPPLTFIIRVAKQKSSRQHSPNNTCIDSISVMWNTCFISQTTLLTA